MYSPLERKGRAAFLGGFIFEAESVIVEVVLVIVGTLFATLTIIMNEFRSVKSALQFETERTWENKKK